MSPFLHALDREWASLASTPDARRALIRWSARQPALAGFRSLDELLEGRRDPGRAPGLLAALAALAPTDELAARTLLQAMVPGLVRLAGRTGSDDAHAIEELVSLAWERIRTYPASRRGSTAGNILLDVRKWYRRHRLIEQPTTSLPIESDPADGENTPEQAALGRLLLAEVATARRAGIVSPRAMDWIVRTRVLGEPIECVAAGESISPRVLCQRRWRAERRLRELDLAG